MSGTLRLNDTTFATETNGNITTNVSELKINDQTVIDSNKSLNVSDVKVGGNTVIDSNRKMTGVDIVPTTNFTFRNKIINGNLKSARVINQRGATSITGATGYTYDRWYYDGSNYLYQGIEDLNVNNGTYCVSWVGDNLIAHWALEDDNDTTPPYIAGPDSALTWNQVSKNSTFTINESPEHGKHLWIRFSLDTGGDFANLDKVQVEEGTVPTPFEHRPYGIELSLCQRYYEELELRNLLVFLVPIFNTNLLTIYYKVQKRANPMINNPSCSNFQPGGSSGTTSAVLISKNSAVLDCGSNDTSFQVKFYNAVLSLTIDAEL